MGPRKPRGISQASMESSSNVTVRKMSKRLCDQEDITHDSLKKLQYDPSSSHMEKRDSRYCKVVEKQPAPTLKSLRFSLDEEDEEDFCGFIHDDVKDRSDWVKHQVTVLKETQELIDQFV